MVWYVKDAQGIDYMTKVVANHSSELRAIRKMVALGSPTQTHTIPVQIIECSQTSILLMPYLWKFPALRWKDAGLHIVFDLFNQILEARLTIVIA